MKCGNKRCGLWNFAIRISKNIHDSKRWETTRKPRHEIGIDKELRMADINEVGIKNTMRERMKILPPKVWILFTSLYTTQYIGIGFLTIALVIILRKEGMPLDKIGLIPLMATPVALKFLWAPVVDKYLKGKKGHYRTWLLGAQFLMMAALFAIAFRDPVKDYGTILKFVLLYTFATATQDLALSGLICNVFEKDERNLISSVRASGSMLGNIIGGGVVLLMYPYIGWKTSLFILAALLFITWAQILFFDEFPTYRVKYESENTDKRYWRNMVDVWKGRGKWLLVLFLLPFGILPSYNLVSPKLVDAGWSLPEIAILFKVFGSVVSLVAIVWINKLLQKMTRRKGFFVSVLAHSLCLFSFVPISMGYTSGFVVYFAFFLYFSTVPMVFVSLAAVIMDNVADSPAPSTAYNIQTAVSYVVGFPVVAMSMALAKHLGYFPVTLGSILFALVVALIARKAVKD